MFYSVIPQEKKRKSCSGNIPTILRILMQIGLKAKFKIFMKPGYKFFRGLRIQYNKNSRSFLRGKFILYIISYS